MEQKTIKNAVLAAGGFLRTGRRNTPPQYKSRNRQYFEGETLKNISQYAKYSSDFFDCEAQGLDVNDPERWVKARIRIANVVRPSASITRSFDDYKMILVESPHVDYIRPGTKFRTMGSTWLMVNADNLSAVAGSGMIRRCNAVWRYLDFYGNLCEEQICVENHRANANDPDSQETVSDTKGYYHVVAQYNGFTSKLNDNTRLILGSKAYVITGYGDFEAEFTETESVRLLHFTIRFDEINDQIDDMERKVAGGKLLEWTAEINGSPEARVGTVTRFTATAKRNGIEVENTESCPIHFQWESSDREIAEVTAGGKVTAKAVGTARITARLVENPSVYVSYPVEVVTEEESPKVIFTSDPPRSIPAFKSASISAGYFSGGQKTEEEVNWSFAGAEESAYSVIYGENEITIKCWHGSVGKLTVTAELHGETASAEIELEGL